MNKGMKNIARTCLLMVMGLVLGINIYLLNAQKLTGNQVPMPFGVGASVVLSGSMEPELSVGDLLILTEEETYAEGDVVVYQSGSMAVVHRIIALDGETVTTQGDANNAADEPVPLTAIKGRVMAVIPLVGYAVWALKTPLGILLTIAAAVLLVELSYRSGKAEQDAEKEKIKEEIRQLLQELEAEQKD